MTELIKLVDYSDVPNECTAYCKALQDEIEGKNYSIINLSGDDKDPPTIFSNGGRRTDRYVGVLQYDGKKVIIGSRFDDKDRPWFLNYIFEKSFDEYGRLFENMNIDGKPDSIWDVLLIITFFRQMKAAFKKGFYRKYQSFNYNDPKAKGTLDIPRHIKENVFSNGKIAYSTREYSANNYYNILLLMACQRLYSQQRDKWRKLIVRYPEIKRMLQLLRSENPGWDSVKPTSILRRTEKPIVHSIHREYESLRVISRLILQRKGVDYNNADKKKVTGFVIDISKLWERFLQRTLFTNSDGWEPQKKYYVMNKHREFEVDFINEKKKIVLDAKYKKGWGSTYDDDMKNQTWSDYVRGDVFQILAYMLALSCDKGGVVFPVRNKEIKGISPKNIEPESIEIYSGLMRWFYRFPYYIPTIDSANYADFKKEIEEREVDLRNKINKSLDKNSKYDLEIVL